MHHGAVEKRGLHVGRGVLDGACPGAGSVGVYLDGRLKGLLAAGLGTIWIDCHRSALFVYRKDGSVKTYCEVCHCLQGTETEGIVISGYELHFLCSLLEGELPLRIVPA